MPSLREKLKALEELQQIDLDSNEVRLELETIPARRAEIEPRVHAARRAYDEEKARLEGTSASAASSSRCSAWSGTR